MRNSALAWIAVFLAGVTLDAQSNALLERAVERIERNDANGLRRLLEEDLTTTSVQVDVELPPAAYQWLVYAYSARGQNIGCSFLPRGFVVRPPR